ncbi:MAG: glycosyltransferase [Verrucomicrobia bacterium]|nr:glycosyltransferase [Verrucomicrobiota bacterium]
MPDSFHSWLALLLALLAFASLGTTLWQFLVALKFPLHRRSPSDFSPAVTLLKPLKGTDEFTAACLRSWLAQDYAGEVQVLFGVAAADDPACEVVRQLLVEFPQRDAQLVICGESLGANAKVSTLIQLARLAKHEVISVSDADVRVPVDFLANAVQPLHDAGTGLVNCFYSLANPTTAAMRWEAVAINADFWSQVLQSRSLKPMDFALGAVMITRRPQLDEIGGFEPLADYLADDYQLGNQIARRGHRIALATVVAECWSPPMGWAAVWAHQLRWARTIRCCQPGPYFLSIISNASLWPLLWVLVQPGPRVCLAFFACWIVRVTSAMLLQFRLTRSRGHLFYDWLIPLKDLLGAVIWLQSFIGNEVVWRGRRYRVLRGGKLEPRNTPSTRN